MGEITQKQTTPAEIITAYLDSQDLKPKSKETYKRSLKAFTNYLTANNITRATKIDILNYKTYLMSEYKPATVSAYLVAIKGLYRYLESEGITNNITSGIKGVKATKGHKKDCLSVEQAKQLLSSFDLTNIMSMRDFAIINLLIRTGLRTVEIERANIEDIRHIGGNALLYVQGKGRDEKDEYVILTTSVLEPITNYLKARGKVKDTSPLFASTSNNNKSGRLTTRTISNICKTALVNIGLDNSRITAHSLRHTAVTFSLLAGATLQETQQLARHSNINTTMIYAHNIDRINKGAEYKIDKLLF